MSIYVHLPILSGLTMLPTKENVFRESLLFPVEEYVFFFQENGYSSLKNVSKMYQRCKIMNICIRSVCVLFWKMGHMWKHYLLVTNWGVGREAVCVRLWTSGLTGSTCCKHKPCTLEKPKRDVSLSTWTQIEWSINRHGNLNLIIQHAWHTLGGPCTSSLPPLMDLPDLVFWHVLECNVLY